MNRPFVAGTLVAITISTAGAAEGPPRLESEQIELGRKVYGQYCATCHGSRGEGAANWQEQNDQGELPPPPHGPEGHTWRHADAALYHTIAKGWRDPFNKTDRLTMPAFEEILTPDEIRAVSTYLKTLWTEEQRQFQWEQSEDRPFPNEQN